MAEHLLALTREMLDCATQGDWDRLVALEKRRLPIFQQFLAGGIADKADLARDVLAMDEKIRALAAAGLPVIQDELLKLRNSGKASSAYQSIQNAAPSGR